MDDKTRVGDRVRKRRMELGMSQAELSRLLGYTSRSSVNKIECGKNAVQTDTLLELAEKLDTTVDYLLGSMERDLRMLGYQLETFPSGIVHLHDVARSVSVAFTPDLWRKLEEADAFTRVVDYLNGLPEGTRMYYVEDLPEAKKEAPAPVTEDKRTPIDLIFAQLSEANQSKLLELAHLFLAAQSSNEETK